MLAGSALRQAAVHAVPAGQHVAGALEQHLAVRGKQALMLGRLEDADHAEVGLAAPVGAGAVAAVMADVNGLVSLGRRGVLNREEFVRIQVVSGTGVFFHQSADGNFRPLGLCEGDRDAERQKGRQGHH